jgi:gluconokinase
MVLRYGWNRYRGSRELSDCCSWMVFIGAMAAYPVGEHMAFTSLLAMLTSRASWRA